MSVFDLSCTELDEIQNHDDFIVVWASPNDVPSKLNYLVDYLKKYHSQENCIDYIKQVKSDRKILLVTNDLQSISVFEDLKQIQSIYVLQEDNQNTELNRNDHPKVVGIFENQDQLTDRLRKDILLTYRNDLPISVSSLNEITTEQSLTNLHGNTLMFLWDQLFIYYLLKSPNIDMNKAKTDMLEQCRLEYENNEIVLKQIDDFDGNCSVNNALQWYTKDSFVYRLLNKAFRTRNIQLIRKFQYFLILLSRNFEELSKEIQEDPSVVYRGQLLKEHSLRQLTSNVHRLISINTIMSTSRNEKVARLYVLGATHAVVFKIHLPKVVYSSFKPFVDIGRLSSYPNEQEIIFFVGTVFSIDSVRQEDHSTWFIELTLNTDMPKHIGKLLDEFQLSIQFLKNMPHRFMQTDDFNMINCYYHMLTKETFSINNIPSVMMHVHLAFVLSNLGFYDKAIELYKNALVVGEMSVMSPESKVLHIIIGHLYYHLSKYDDALTYYGLVLSLFNETDLLTSELFKHIGDVWKKLERIDIALSCYEKALTIADGQISPSLLAIYRNVVDIFRREGDLDRAFVYGEQAKEIDHKDILVSTLGDEIPVERYQLNLTKELTPVERADSLYRVGLFHMKNGEFDQALKHFLQAQKCFLEEPPAWNRFTRHLSTLFDNIALLYLFSNDYLEALTYWKKGIDIRSHFYQY